MVCGVISQPVGFILHWMVGTGGAGLWAKVVCTLRAGQWAEVGGGYRQSWMVSRDRGKFADFSAQGT